jgi:hypothetical protein
MIYGDQQIRRTQRDDSSFSYWGDLDTWGLRFLADARQKQPHVEALMMDQEILLAHVDWGVCEERSAELPEQGLTIAERVLFDGLRSNRDGIGRLDQERLS